MFEQTIKVLSNALNSVDESAFMRLANDCEATLRRGNKIIASGLGKNVPICDKFVGSMLSLGLNAGFMHTNTAVHGDLGMVHDGDLVIVLTKSGSTTESVYLVDLLKLRKVKVWLLTCTKDSILSHKVDDTILLELEHEGDQWNIMPNNSTTLNLIVLQELAMSLSVKMHITLDEFKMNHPGGAIGVKLKG